MDKKVYFELHIKPTDSLDLFSDLIFCFGYEAIEEKDGYLIVRDDNTLEDLEFGINEFARRLSSKFNKTISVETKFFEKYSEDWVKNYMDSVQPIEIGNFFIRPQWKEKREDKIDIIVNPALAFGSGHHESTYGCIKMLEKYVKPKNTVLDVGCGSGILSIIALKLGAIADCCDTDEQAIKSSIENFSINEVNPNKYWTGSIDAIKNTYDMVVANIIYDIIVIISKNLIKAMKDKGCLILSGILEKDKELIIEHFSNLNCTEIYKKNEWYTIVFKKVK